MFHAELIGSTECPKMLLWKGVNVLSIYNLPLYLIQHETYILKRINERGDIYHMLFFFAGKLLAVYRFIWSFKTI